MKNVCGSTDTKDGEPCGRVAGWGTDSDMGHCRDHAEEYRVPRKLTPERREKIIGAAARGAMLKHCAGVAGIDESTLHRWLAQGKRHTLDDIDSPLADLYASLQRARGEGAVRRLGDASDEFVLKASFGYTPREAVDIDIDASDDGRDAQIDELLTELDDVY